MEIRDTRNGDWYWVNNALLACESISITDKVVYSALATFAGYNEIRPTFEIIADRCSVSVRAAKDSVSNLKESGFVNIKNHGHKKVANVYELNKAITGCIKKCKPCTLKVQGMHFKSANPAPHIDRYIDNKKNDFSKEKSLSSENDIPLNNTQVVKLGTDGDEVEKEEKSRKIPSSVLVINNQFRELCEKHIGEKPRLEIGKQGAIIKSALKVLSEKEIYDLFDWWFNEPQQGKEDYDLIQITQALSSYNIDKYKVVCKT